MTMFEVPVGPASDLVATRRGLHRIAIRWALVAMAALVLLSLGTWRWLHRDKPVEGPRTPAAVVDVVTHVVGWGRTHSGFVTVEFTIDGQSQRSRVKVGNIGNRFAEGDVIDVVYEPTNPDRVAIVGEATRSSGVPAASLLGLGALIALAAGVGVRKVRWIHRIIADYAWVPVTCALVEIPVALGLRERSHTLLRLWDESGTVVVERADHGLIPPSLVPIAWVAGLGRPRFVVSAPGGARLIPVKPVRQHARTVRTQRTP
jgi:hypothetical protein